MEPITFPKGTAIGVLEAVELVTAEDPIWKEPVDPIVAAVSDASEQEQRKQTLGEEVSIKKECSAKDRSTLLDIILANHCTFALSDEDLGETDLVEHDINLTDSVPITTDPRIPYVLCAELERVRKTALKTNCIEPSTSSYSSGLVLVRKKDGSLRVCVCGLTL